MKTRVGRCGVRALVVAVIDQSNGNKGNSLTTKTWYDTEGRAIKVQGEQLSKTIYDRFGRATNRFTIGVTDDSAYADALDVTGDKVLEESQTYFDNSTGLALMSVLIQRHAGDKTTTGALDTDSDLSLVDYTTGGGKIKGRAQISWTRYDDLNRPTYRGSVGTNGGSNFDRDTDTSTSLSDTNLVTAYSYNDDGTVLDVTDPRALVSRTLYDALGRKTATLANYVNGTPSGDNNDDDVYTRYEYTNGLMTKMWVDWDGDGVKDASDQVTTYIYGGTSGTPSQMKIANGNLLRAVKYPDTSNTGTTVANIDSDSSDVVSYAYNAQGQRVYTKDQAGNVIENDYDTAGRQTQRRVTNLAGGFDGAVKRIATAYLGRGPVDTIADVNHSGTITSQDQTDWNSIVGGSGASSDINFDGDLGTSQDDTDFGASYSDASTGGVGVLSRSKTANRIGYAGYLWDPVIAGYHVRHRIYKPDLGRLISRDPMGYIDGSNLYEYMAFSPTSGTDPLGLFPVSFQAPPSGDDSGYPCPGCNGQVFEDYRPHLMTTSDYGCPRSYLEQYSGPSQVWYSPVQVISSSPSQVNNREYQYDVSEVRISWAGHLQATDDTFFTLSMVNVKYARTTVTATSPPVQLDDRYFGQLANLIVSDSGSVTCDQSSLNHEVKLFHNAGGTNIDEQSGGRIRPEKSWNATLYLDWEEHWWNRYLGMDSPSPTNCKRLEYRVAFTFRSLPSGLFNFRSNFLMQFQAAWCCDNCPLR